MIGTLMEYIKKYGAAGWEELPFNDVDALVLCQLAYLKFDNSVPNVMERRGDRIRLSDITDPEQVEALFGDVRHAKEDKAFYKAICRSDRFRDIKIGDYINEIRPDWDIQFCAMVFEPYEGMTFVAFRGTDETIVGWREDFDLAFRTPVAGQRYSAEYINQVAGDVQGRLIVGGHSKGGNLAVYGSMMCREDIQDRIERIYSMDGPGFRDETLEECHYERIADRVTKIVPHSSVVGMLFENRMDFKVVGSIYMGLRQHYMYSWLINGTEFVCIKDIKQSARLKDETINRWIQSLDEEQLRVFSDVLFGLLTASDCDNLIDLTMEWRRSITAALETMKDVDQETRDILSEIGKQLVDIATQEVKSDVTDRVNRAINSPSKILQEIRNKQEEEQQE